MEKTVAVVNVDLGSGNAVVNESNADSGDVVNVSALGSNTLTVDGVDVTLGTVANIQAASAPTFAVQNGGSLTINQGLLNVNALSATTFNVGDSGSITLNASGVDVGLITGLLNTYTVNYSGESDTGTFTYQPTLLSVGGGVAPVNFTVTGMGATDQFTVEGRTLSLDTTFLGGPRTAYRDGFLNLEYNPGLVGGLVTQGVQARVPMTEEQANLFFANPGTYLSGSTFTFPGTLAIPCFVAGSLIDTHDGIRAIEELCIGDMVKTRDTGYQPIRWIGCSKIDGIDLAVSPQLCPIRIKAGALGAGTPSTDLLVSPQHRILVRSKIAERMFGSSEVLVAAQQLLQVEGIDVAEAVTEVRYFHMLFDQHEIVFSNGAETESLYTGPEALKAIGKEARDEIFTLFPELQTRSYVPVPARPLLSGRRARKVAVRHMSNHKPLVSAYI